MLADRGFTITDDMLICGAKLELPSFTTGKKKQLSQNEVETSQQQLSRIRIHVERVIGTMKNRYTILKDLFPHLC